MANNVQLQATSFHLVLEKFKASLTDKEKTLFGGTTLHDLHVAIEKIQQQQASEKRLQGMRRLEKFLEGMKGYDKVISVFVNSSQILAFVWGPMKFLLQTACTFFEAFDALMDAYQQIGEHIPLLTQYEHHFRNQSHMTPVLRLLYEDMLNFHWKAMKFFKQRMWKQLFRAVWRSFDTEFSHILRDLREHRYLIESQASITEFAEIMRTQELAKTMLYRQEEEETSRRRETVYQWLLAAPYEVDQEMYAKVRQEYPGTGKWLLKVNRFQSWFDPDFCSNQLLWLTGIPGAGKTILASLVIEEARKLPGVTVAFFYCKYQDNERNTFLAVARGILAQLLHQDDGILAYLYDEASKSGQTTLATDALARKLLRTAVKNHQKLYIILDGIDECEVEQRKEIVTTFEDLWESLSPNDVDSLRCLFVSQDDRAAKRDFGKMVSLRITENDLKRDIRTYASVWSLKIQARLELAGERQRYIEDMITGMAEGMFLYARLMSSHLYSQTSVRALDYELCPDVFPRGPLRLDKVYERITSQLFGADGPVKSDALTLLSWLVCAKRPLRWHEIQCAVSVNLEEQTVEWDQGRFRVDHKDLCGPLVDIHLDNSVNLVHHTAKRYLVDRNLVDMAGGERSFASLCVGYLSFPCFEADIERDHLQTLLSLGYYGFLDYAYAYWAGHLYKTLSMQHPQHALNEIAETVSIFIDMYWSPTETKVSVPKSVLDLLKPLSKEGNFDRIATAVHLARKRLLSSTKASPEETVLNLDRVVARVRVALEEAACSCPDQEKFKRMYGSNLFKCPRVNCIYFYKGFPTQQKRDDHVPQHERAYFCSFSGCHMAKLGCATLKELQKHETDYHGTINLDDDDDDDQYPELPAEKVSFDCKICGATFTRKHNLNNHTRIKHSDGGESFLCSTCGKRFDRRGDRTRHEGTAHSDAKRFTCGGALSDGTQWGCGHVFKRGDILNRHWKSEKGKACILPKREEEALETLTSTPVNHGPDTPLST